MTEKDLEQTRLASHVTRFKMVENICMVFSHSNIFALILCKKETEDKLLKANYSGKYFVIIKLEKIKQIFY